MRLAEIENQILFHLSLDARQSLSGLAKKIGKSKQIVSYHLNRLEQEGIITGYHAITNIYALGKTHYRIFLRLQKISREKEAELMTFLNNHPKIIWTAEFGGDLDLAFLVWADNIHEFEKVFDEVSTKFGTYIYKKEFSITTKIDYLKYKFFTNSNNTTKRTLGGRDTRQYILDDLDKKILACLNINGRDPFSLIASQLKTSPITVQKRIEKMCKNNVIIGFNYKLNHQKLKLTHRKIRIILDNHSDEILDKMTEYLKKNPHVIYIIKTIGEYDFEFEIMTYKDEDYKNLVREFNNNFYKEIKTHSTLIHYLEPKSGQMAQF